MTIQELCEKAFIASANKGFHNPTPSSLEKIALVMSELGEAVEELRRGTPVQYSENGKPEGVLVELADAVIRIADMCGQAKWDLEGAIKEKMAYNATRAYRHGKKF